MKGQNLVIQDELNQLEILRNQALVMERVIHDLIKEQEQCPHCRKKWGYNDKENSNQPGA